ncbi:SDR family oxidoreductase, partial [Klebsiella pneumoniae]|uniref:SDR family oxidoreductase n=1 Tax=Klebsiella pneumoniae TaxID=573 RepID=UPI0029391361
CRSSLHVPCRGENTRSKCPFKFDHNSIRVNAVAPGPYWTVLQSSGGQPDEKVKQFGKDTPMGRPGQPVEIAPLYVTLASDACSYTSGQVWCSDGGDGVV